MNDKDAIHDIVRRWMDASKAGDMETVLSLMTDDVVFMVPGQPPFGKKTFAETSEAMDEMEIETENEILEIEVQGDIAWMRQALSVTIKRSEVPPVRRSGHTLTIFRRENGTWRLARDANLLAEG